MKSIKPIETVYNGYRFRSRLEARWAVFFDYLKIPYEYESDGYKICDEYYLPDFYLPSFERFFEVKGKQPTNREIELAQSLARETGLIVHIAWGNIPMPDSKCSFVNGDENVQKGESILSYHPGGNECWDGYSAGGLWGFGDAFVVYDDGSVDLTQKLALGIKCDDPLKGKGWTPIDAYRAARSARFEHGEKPQINKTTRKVKSLYEMVLEGKGLCFDEKGNLVRI